MVNKPHESGVENYSPEYLECREAHNWEWLTDWKILRNPSGRINEFSRLKRCTRCKTLASRRFDGATGRVLPNRTSYTYPDGYLSSRKNPIHAGEARLEMLRRAGIPI